MKPHLLIMTFYNVIKKVCDIFFEPISSLLIIGLLGGKGSAINILFDFMKLSGIF